MKMNIRIDPMDRAAGTEQPVYVLLKALKSLNVFLKFGAVSGRSRIM